MVLFWIWSKSLFSENGSERNSSNDFSINKELSFRKLEIHMTKKSMKFFQVCKQFLIKYKNDKFQFDNIRKNALF